MKTLIVAEQLRRRVPGGIGTYVRGLLKGLDQVSAGIDVTLWASRARSEGEVEALGVPVETVPLPSFLLTRAWDRGLVSPPAGFDVLHATSMAVPPRSKAPMTAMVHDLAWRRFPEAFPERGRRWHEAALGRVLDRCRLMVVPASETADDLMADGISSERIVVIPEGGDHLPPPDRDAAERKLAEAGVRGEYLLAVGTLEPRKNLVRLARAYALALPKLPEPWPLLIVGPAGWGDAFVAPEGVVVVGRAELSVIAALYERCRAFVSVPLWEGFGLPVLEAMSMGAPVVASPMPSNGDAVLEVDPTDESSIASGIVNVATDDETRTDLITRGRERVTQLTWRHCAEEHIRTWESL